MTALSSPVDVVPKLKNVVDPIFSTSKSKRTSIISLATPFDASSSERNELLHSGSMGNQELCGKRKIDTDCSPNKQSRPQFSSSTSSVPRSERTEPANLFASYVATAKDINSKYESFHRQNAEGAETLRIQLLRAAVVEKEESRRKEDKEREELRRKEDKEIEELRRKEDESNLRKIEADFEVFNQDSKRMGLAPMIPANVDETRTSIANDEDNEMNVSFVNATPISDAIVAATTLMTFVEQGLIEYYC